MRIYRYRYLLDRVVLVSIFFACLVGPMSALDFTVGASGAYSTESRKNFFVDGSIALHHSEGPFTLSWELTADSKGTYPESFLADFFGPFSLDIKNAGFTYMARPLSFFLGKLPLKDEINSPYSLFISGASPSVMTGGFRFDSGIFSFSDQWIGLDHNVKNNLYKTTEAGIYADRGIVLKTYSLDVGALKLGYQDVVLFTGSYFDVDIFAIPAPSALLQDILTASGRPSSRSGDMNSIMGFFGEYRNGGLKLCAQILIDDFNMNRFIAPSAYQNPDKIAWSLGSEIDLSLGKLSLYTAGATKYTFESVREEFYSYTLHAGSAIYSDSQLIAVPLENQMLGYINGENNLAFMANWSAPIAQLDLETGLECVISGSKAPTNPWHNGEDWASLGTQLLNDPALEVKLLLNLRISRKWGDFTLFMQTTGGYVFNQLNPVYPGESGYPILTYSDGDMLEPVFVPKVGDSAPIAEIILGGIWSLY
mgnify:CR=1 FL=1